MESFLTELSSSMPTDDVAWLVIGNFNLTRSPADKNNSNFDWNLARKFNTTIEDIALIELYLLDWLYT